MRRFLLLVVLLALGLPGAASAATLSGTTTDPTGDSQGGGGARDITRVSSTLDTTTGNWSVTIDIAQSATAATASNITTLLYQPDSSGQCPGSERARIRAATTPTTTDETVTFTASDGTITGGGADKNKTVGQSGAEFILNASSPSLEGLGDVCVAVGLARNQQSYDQLDAPLRLAQPSTADRDGDHVIDALDRCPDTYATTASGCPEATVPADRDGDGVPDTTDNCPNDYAQTADGCPAGTGTGDPGDTDQLKVELASSARTFHITKGGDLKLTLSPFTLDVAGSARLYVLRGGKTVELSSQSYRAYPGAKVQVAVHLKDAEVRRLKRSAKKQFHLTLKLTARGNDTDTFRKTYKIVLKA